MMLTPEERALRDAFLAECWKPVRQWHPADDDATGKAYRNEMLAVWRDGHEIAGEAA